MMFTKSAQYYDALYAEKNYSTEVDYLDALIQRHMSGALTLLDLGCGTGRHAIKFTEKGYRVVGVDRSPEMLGKADNRRLGLPPQLRERLLFEQQDIRSLSLHRCFDAVVALFHVVSYQTSNHDLIAALAAAKAHVKSNGVFVFDCWYGPGVLRDPPTARVKRWEDDSYRFLRIAEPVVHFAENTVDVHYQFITVEKATGACTEFAEMHTMRYFFAPELSIALQHVGLELVALTEWMQNYERDATPWSVAVIARPIT
jgi:SAM-dependent methyltransferase